LNLAAFPRRRYTEGTTPIEFLPRFSKAVGGPNIYIKRDDLLGLTSGGNKTRKLEFLVADALAQGADTLVTCGAVQSNHCRLTLAAANKEGLKCRLVLEERVPNSYKKDASGNNFLFHLLGVDGVTVVPGGSDMLQEMDKVAQSLIAEGRKPYIIPGGGSNPVGSLGYVACAQEIVSQLFASGLSVQHIVSASGSGGTHSGLLAGLVGSNADIPITGINVSRKQDVQTALIHGLANETLNFLGVAQTVSAAQVVCLDQYVGDGYSRPTAGMVEAVTLLAQTEGILLDPVYTGKAMAGLIDLARSGYFKPEENVLFVHTGGSPALYAYMPVLLGASS